MEGLHPPGHPIIAAVIMKAIKEKTCIRYIFVKCIISNKIMEW